MDTNNEILDAIEILADRKISENITKVLTGVCKSVNINKNTCVMDSNGVSSTVQFYGSPPEANELYRIFVPSNDMSRSFIIVPPRFTVNPNLLDNWYFGNPVNQRGQTSYTGNSSPIIDRWNMRGDAVSITLEDDGLVINCDGQSFNAIVQAYEFPKQLLGKKVTFSVLVTENTSKNTYIVVGNATQRYAVGTVLSRVDFSGVGLFSLTVDIPTSLSNKYLTFSICAGSPSVSGARFKVVAAKLELGSQQTLAHLENGNWVLNEIPDYGEQLARCQRYFWRFSPAEYVAGATAFGIDANTARAMVYLPEQMRTSPALNLNASEGFFLTGASGDIFNTTVSTVWTASNSVYVDFKKSGAFEVNAPYFVRGGVSAYIDISADL